jgi:glutamate formiminotransferase
MRQTVQCVPNFSEGRRQDVIDSIVAAMSSTPGAQVLDAQSDLDHNRSVVTLVGSPQATVEAVFHGIARAAELIDMNHHRGAHPRMGATDVVPFAPVRNVTLDDCAALARQLGDRVGTELGIPVYLYESAASRPDRHNLSQVRRGEYEGLSKEIGTDPERLPDFGPASMGAAGATAIGARFPLVAFNVYLNTDNVTTAKTIARAVRHSSGGLRCVKALGMLVEGQAQVSMNLTNYRLTPIHRVVELIRAEADHFGVSVTRSEVVGLLPAEALLDAAVFYLQLHGFHPDQVLENRLSDDAGVGESG